MDGELLNKRAAGVLLAVSSLPSPYGIGTFGEEARAWLRFINNSCLKYWQILPLGPTGWGDSPYMSFSAFALSPYYIDLDTLVHQGLLSREEINSHNWGRKADKTDYAALFKNRELILRLAAGRFRETDAFGEFYSHNKYWLDDYCLFMSLKKKLKNKSWMEWKNQFKLRSDETLEKCRLILKEDIQYHLFVQYSAFTQWDSIKEYARSLGVSIIGDLPIYVASDSADTWANCGLFQLDENRMPLRVAGCPPDAFSANGQLWGNPLYRWDIMALDGFSWWLSRLKLSFELYDVVRIDHFRGLESYYSIDAKADTAAGGHWEKGPGLAFIEALNKALPAASVIAEDLGYLTPEVKALQKASGYPGMKVLQFAFDSRESGDYMPYTYDKNCVVYTGTHDNCTSKSWFVNAPEDDVQTALDYFGIKDIRDGTWAFIRAAFSSAANTAIIPMQDFLELDDRARMNIPSTTGNWRWRMLSGTASDELAKKIRRLAQITGRG